jgi:hypothetical protein
MAFIFSTGLRNALLGNVATITAATISADETGGTFTILDSGNALLTSGFRPGDTVVISGFTGTAANNQITTVNLVAATGATMTIAGTLVDEVASEAITITAVAKGFKQLFKNYVIRVYSGTAPATADAAETGTLLLVLTLSSGAVTAGTSTNGNNFGTISAGVLAKDASVCSGVGLADGTAGYYRMYDNGIITGVSSTSIRCQGTVATSGGEFTLSSTSIVTGATTTLDTHNITLPSGA